MSQASDTAELLDVADLRWRVEDRLIGFLSAKADSCPPEDEESTLSTPTASLLLSSGKRLRAAFCFWGWRGAGGADSAAAIAAASALELLHGCALIHDDVMDASAMRRGQPAVHRHFAANHFASNWRGSPAHFGMAAAILAGDLCLVWADQMLRESGLSAQSLHRAGSIYDAMREQTIRGQYLDLVMQARGTAGVREAWRVAQGKTVASTTSGPLAFGAELAGAGEEVLAAYEAYAEPLGVAFQLRDDLLGAFGDPCLTGKPSGDDLHHGKATVLLAQARQRGGPRIADEIDVLLREESSDAVDRLRELMESTGARSSVEKLIGRLCTQSAAALDAAPIHPQAQRVLQGLATAIGNDPAHA